MKIVSFRAGGAESFGILHADGVVDLAEVLHGKGKYVPSTLREFLEMSTDPIGALRQFNSAVTWPLGSVEIVAPLPRPSKIVAVGLNYRDHCREQGVDPPKSPVLFAKYPTSVIGHCAEIVWDTGLTSKVDYEAELGVVIGKRARNVSPGDAFSYVFGYTIVNDVSARDLQFGDGQWVRGKSLDTFCPMGPCIVTADEIPDPHALGIRCSVNGAVLQDSRTDQMIFRVPDLVAFITCGITLEPGDVIATGTPAGVGVFRKPPRYLKDGDDVAVEIDHIGALRNRCRTVRTASSVPNPVH
jgi:2-keto-4-pentenoate hydratase/2-oxohepta-3-ene-1,7-dioic acid hydratase in catechol pathway